MQGRHSVLTIHETLIFIAKRNHQQYVHLFEQREYGKILRTASFNLDKPLVELMLQVRGQIALNVNAQSPSNKNTALDWVFETRSKDADLQIEVMGILIRAGALSQDQLVDAQGYDAGSEGVSDLDQEESQYS